MECSNCRNERMHREASAAWLSGGGKERRSCREETPPVVKEWHRYCDHSSQLMDIVTLEIEFYSPFWKCARYKFDFPVEVHDNWFDYGPYYLMPLKDNYNFRLFVLVFLSDQPMTSRYWRHCSEVWKLCYIESELNKYPRSFILSFLCCSSDWSRHLALHVPALDGLIPALLSLSFAFTPLDPCTYKEVPYHTLFPTSQVRKEKKLWTWDNLLLLPPALPGCRRTCES